MSTDEGPNVPGGVADDHAEREDRDRSGERIGLAGGDDSVTLIQLAARWAESDSPDTDSLASRLRRFRAAYEYVDAVVHGVRPPDLDHVLAAMPLDRQTAAAPAHTQTASPSSRSASAAPTTLVSSANPTDPGGSDPTGHPILASPQAPPERARMFPSTDA